MFICVAGMLGLFGLEGLQYDGFGEMLNHHCHIFVTSICDGKGTTEVHAPPVEQSFNGKRVELERLCVKGSLYPETHCTTAHYILGLFQHTWPPVIDEK